MGLRDRVRAAVDGLRGRSSSTYYGSVGPGYASIAVSRTSYAPAYGYAAPAVHAYAAPAYSYATAPAYYERAYEPLRITAPAPVAPVRAATVSSSQETTHRDQYVHTDRPDGTHEERMTHEDARRNTQQSSYQQGYGVPGYGVAGYHGDRFASTQQASHRTEQFHSDNPWTGHTEGYSHQDSAAVASSRSHVGFGYSPYSVSAGGWSAVDMQAEVYARPSFY